MKTIALTIVATCLFTVVAHADTVDFAGDKFTVTFDGKTVIEASDSIFTAPGKVGVWTKADSVTLFDDEC